LSQTGSVALQIGHQWIVHVYHLWENDFRAKISNHRGLTDRKAEHPYNNLSVPHIGDLSLMRNDILKHRGVASRNNSGRCKVLKWFGPGETMLVTDSMVYEFMKAFGLSHPAEGEVPADQIHYKFHGVVESPIRLRAGNTPDSLQGKLQRISGAPLNENELRTFIGTQMIVEGRDGEETAMAISYVVSREDAATATVTFRASPGFVSEVARAERTAHWPVGTALPDAEHRFPAQLSWVRSELVVAEMHAPEGTRYDLRIYLENIGIILPIASAIGDLHEGKLVGAQYGPRGLWQMQLYLEVPSLLARNLEHGQLKAFLPALLPDVLRT